MSYVVGLRFKRQGIREIVEVCILTLGHSPRKFSGSRQSAAADCVTVYPARLPLARIHFGFFAEFLEARIVAERIELWLQAG